MTKIRPVSVESSDWEQARRVVGQFTRDVRDALDASRTGLLWSDNVSRVYECAFNSTSLPFAVRTDFVSRPLAVQLLQAYNPLTNTFVSGGAVEWSWSNGAINLVAIPGLAASTDYQIQFGAWES